MNQGPLVFLGVFAALALSWFGMILQPQLQVGRAEPGTNVVDGVEVYPRARSGLAQQGLQVYRSLGCATCHSQQVRQDGVRLNVMLKSAGTNDTGVVIKAIQALRPGTPAPEVGRMLSDLPAMVLEGVASPEAAAAAVKSLTEVGAKAAVELVALGPDVERGWGAGRTVAADFLFDRPALPGHLRLGPDLANAGERLPGADWHRLHLYDPKAVVTNSVMPPYRFLFERQRVGAQPSVEAIRFAPGTSPVGSGYEMVPTDEGRALVAYLLSLRPDVALWERPLATGFGAGTNAPVTGTSAAAAGNVTNVTVQ